jgi:hypothetical protein
VDLRYSKESAMRPIATRTVWWGVLAITTLLGCLGGIGGGQEALARIQQAPASRVAIDLPDGFRAARAFSGFIDEQAGVSLVIVELPAAAYEQLASGLTPAALASKGIAKAEARKLMRPEPYLYLRGEQASAEGPVAKFMVAFREGDVTALVTANVQKSSLDLGKVRAEQVEQLLASATIARTAAQPREVFRLGYLGPFKPAGTLLGTTHAYTLDGQLPAGPKTRNRVVLIVSPSLDQRALPDPEGHAETLLGGLPGLKSPKIVERRRIMIGELDAVEIVGTATDADGGREIAIYQVLVIAKAGGYFRIVGELPLEQRDELLPELRRIAEGFRPVE